MECSEACEASHFIEKCKLLEESLSVWRGRWRADSVSTDRERKADGISERQQERGVTQLCRNTESLPGLALALREAAVTTAQTSTRKRSPRCLPDVCYDVSCGRNTTRHNTAGMLMNSSVWMQRVERVSAYSPVLWQFGKRAGRNAGSCENTPSPSGCNFLISFFFFLKVGLNIICFKFANRAVVQRSLHVVTFYLLYHLS